MHNVMVTGTVTAMFAGFDLWAPKAIGRKLDERLGKLHFWMWMVGFCLTFLPMYQLGASGMPRRYADYASTPSGDFLNLVLSLAALLLAVGLLPFLWRSSPRSGGRQTSPTIPGREAIPWSGPRAPRHPSTTSIASRASGRSALHGTSTSAGVGRRRWRTGPRRPPAMPEDIRFFIRTALFGVVLAVVYWLRTYHALGTALLTGFGAAASFLAVVFTHARRANGWRPSGRPWAWRGLDDRAGPPLGMEPTRYPDPGCAPVASGAGLALAALGAVFGPAMLVVSAPFLLFGGWTWLMAAVAEYRAGAEGAGTRARESY